LTAKKQTEKASEIEENPFAKEEIKNEEALTSDAPDQTESEAEMKETLTVVYIGPTVPRTVLIKDSLVYGSQELIDKHFAAGLERVPKAKALIVRADELADSKEKLKTKGSYLAKIYAEVAALIKS